MIYGPPSDALLASLGGSAPTATSRKKEQLRRRPVATRMCTPEALTELVELCVFVVGSCRSSWEVGGFKTYLGQIVHPGLALILEHEDAAAQLLVDSALVSRELELANATAEDAEVLSSAVRAHFDDSGLPLKLLSAFCAKSRIQQLLLLTCNS